MNQKERVAYESALSKLEELSQHHDTESAHVIADEVLEELLTALGLDDVAEAYKRIVKWYA